MNNGKISAEHCAVRSKYRHMSSHTALPSAKIFLIVKTTTYYRLGK